MLHVLGGLAEFERSLILQRTNEGRAKAMAEGKVFGSKPKLTAHQRRDALKRLEAGETTREVALSYNVAHTTIARLNNQLKSGSNRVFVPDPGGSFFGRA